MDTGCLYGGSLTAAILEIGAPAALVSIPARSMYVQPGDLSASERMLRAVTSVGTVVVTTSALVAVIAVAAVASAWWRRGR